VLKQVDDLVAGYPNLMSLSLSGALETFYAMLDDRLLQAFGYPKPSARWRAFVQGALRLRSRLIRALPERRLPHLRTGPRRPTYPRGYQIEELGPPV